MTGRGFLLALAAFVLLTARDGRTQPATVEDIAARFYPQSLVHLAELAGGPPVRHQCQAVLDTDPAGAPRTIVAAYTNGSFAAIRVLRSAPGGDFTVLTEAEGYDFAGVTCGIKLVDLDNDGRNEVFVDFNVMASSVSWVFRWDGEKLINLTPVSAESDGTPDTDLYRAQVVDVDGDGVKEILVVSEYPPPDGEPAEPNLIFRLAGDKYVESEPVIGAWTFRRATGTPTTSRVRVHLPKGARGPFTLHVVNGDVDGTSRVTSAQVSIDNRQVLAPNAFNVTVAAIDRDVTLSTDNELSVRVAGAPGGRMLLILRSRDWDR